MSATVVPATLAGRGESIVPVTTAIVACWMAGAAASHWVGIWLAMGSTAIVLAVVVMASVGRGVIGGGGHVRLSALGVVAGLVMGGVTLAVFEPAMRVAPALRADVARLYGLFAEQPSFAAGLLLPVIVTAEEIVWRGAVQHLLGTRLRPLAAAGVGTLLYALAHLPIGSPALVLTCLVAGGCWALMRVWTNSLRAAVATHLVWDVVVLFVLQLAPPRA